MICGPCSIEADFRQAHPGVPVPALLGHATCEGCDCQHRIPPPAAGTEVQVHADPPAGVTTSDMTDLIRAQLARLDSRDTGGRR